MRNTPFPQEPATMGKSSAGNDCQNVSGRVAVGPECTPVVRHAAVAPPDVGGVGHQERGQARAHRGGLGADRPGAGEPEPADQPQ